MNIIGAVLLYLLLGLLVEEAPVYVADRSEAMWPAEFGVKDGERVRLVVEEPKS